MARFHLSCWGKNFTGLIVGGDIILNIEKGRDKEIEVFMNKARELCHQKQVYSLTW